MKAHSQSEWMSAAKAPLSVLLTAALIFLAFSFVKVSFDITLWSEDARFFCVGFMACFGVMAFCCSKSIQA